MDFGLYLLHTRRLTIHEFSIVLSWQNNFGDLVAAAGARREFVSAHLDNVDDLPTVRAKPLGAIIEKSVKQVLERAGMSIDELVEEWQEWHREHMEPIATYPLTSKFGPAIFVRQAEKRLVGKFLSTDSSPGRGTLIRDGDVVAIPEGTSAFYVGLAIAAKRHNVRVITSNGPLLREFRDNPSVARSLPDFFLVGGKADFSQHHRRSEYGGFYGTETQALFVQKITHDPAATVVVIPFRGMLPSAGPCDLDADTATLKHTIIENGSKHSVREIIFIGDHTKHLESIQEDYGLPVFSTQADWRQLFEAHRDRISIVTAPPPELRAAIKTGRHKDVRTRDLSTDKDLKDLREVREYDRAAKGFEELSRGNGLESRFFEAVD